MNTQDNLPIFYSESTIIDTIKNGGWKHLLSLLILILILFLFQDILLDNFKSNWINICFFIFTILIILSDFIFGIKKIIIVNNKILLYNSFSPNCKEFDIDKISHITFFISPIERGQVLPKAIIYPLENFKGTTINFKIKKSEIYKFLSILQDYGKDVLIFEELRNINDTEYYIQNTDLNITKFTHKKYIIDFDSEEYKSTIPKSYKTASILFKILAIFSIVKLILFYYDLNQLFFIINLQLAFFSFGFSIICNKGGMHWIKWATLVIFFYFIIEITFLILFRTNNILLITSVISQLAITITIFSKLKSKQSPNNKNIH